MALQPPGSPKGFKEYDGAGRLTSEIAPPTHRKGKKRVATPASARPRPASGRPKKYGLLNTPRLTVQKGLFS